MLAAATRGRDIPRKGMNVREEPWASAPTFGSASAPGTAVVRPSAYAVVAAADGRIAVAVTSKGCFLPGGGLEDGESVAEAVCREALEECGLSVRPGAWSARAVQLVYSADERTHFEKRSTFVDATLERVGAAGESDHSLAWLPPGEALARLSHESHRWALDAWLRARPDYRAR